MILHKNTHQIIPFSYSQRKYKKRRQSVNKTGLLHCNEREKETEAGMRTLREVAFLAAPHAPHTTPTVSRRGTTRGSHGDPPFAGRRPSRPCVTSHKHHHILFPLLRPTRWLATRRPLKGLFAFPWERLCGVQGEVRHPRTVWELLQALKIFALLYTAMRLRCLFIVSLTLVLWKIYVTDSTSYWVFAWWSKK